MSSPLPPTSQKREPSLTAANLEARDLAIVLGQSDDYTRFRFALEHAAPQRWTLRDLAERLGVHPSALSRSNFTLAPARRRRAAALLHVPDGFLARDWKPPHDLPATLVPLQVAMERLWPVLNTDGLALEDGWVREARLARLTKALAQAALPEQPASVVTRLVHLCQEFGRAQLERRYDLTLASRDWLLVVGALVDQALHRDAGNLQHPAFVLAKRLVRQFDSAARP